MFEQCDCFIAFVLLEQCYGKIGRRNGIARMPIDGGAQCAFSIGETALATQVERTLNERCCG